MFGALAAATYAAAGQPAGERSVLEEINERLSKMKAIKDPKTGEYRMPNLVDEKHAALCPVCGRPLYMHDGSFECGVTPKIKTQAVECPVCGSKFKAPERCNLNAGGGMDRDFCQHHLGRFAVDCGVWMCCNCGYAALMEDFRVAPSEEEKALVREKLSGRTRDEMFRLVGLREQPDKPIPKYLTDFNSYLEIKDIPDLLKYENAIVLYERRRAPHIAMAGLYREAAHAARKTVCAPLEVLALSQAIRRVNQVLIDPTEGERKPEARRARGLELEKRIKGAGIKGRPSEGYTDADAFCLYVHLAGCADRIGDIAEAREWLSKAAAHIPVDRARDLQGPNANYLKDQVGRMEKEIERRRAMLDKEQEYLRRAAVHLRSAIVSSRLGNADISTAAYLTGELFRRARDFEASLAWFAAASQLLAKAREAGEASGGWKDSDPRGILEIWIGEAVGGPDLSKAKMSEEEAAAAAKAIGEPLADPRTFFRPRPQAAETATGGDAGKGPAARSAVALADPPASCADLMSNVYKAVAAWRRDRGGQSPDSLKDMLDAGYLTASSVNIKDGKCRCPECGAEIRYRKGRFGDADDFLMFHVGRGDNCGKTLFGDGSVR